MGNQVFIQTIGKPIELNEPEIKENFPKKGVVYRELLNKIFRLLKIYQSDSNINEKIIISPPKIKKEGPKKTVFINFNETCEKMNRQKDHLIAFFCSLLLRIVVYFVLCKLTSYSLVVTYLTVVTLMISTFRHSLRVC